MERELSLLRALREQPGEQPGGRPYDEMHWLYPRQPLHQQSCNGGASSHIERPLVSAIVQTFADGGNARQLATRLHGLSEMEVIVNDDSRRDHAAWITELTGPNDFLVSSPNIHELRAYDRLARMARGDFLLLLQGDHCLPRSIDWLLDGLQLFLRYPKLAMLGGQMGFDRVPFKKIAEDISWGVEPCTPIPTRSPGGSSGAGGFAPRANDTAFRFVAGVNIGPLLIRRKAFLEVGGFDETFSCAGAPGIQLDMELSLQLWARGYQVGLWYSGVTNGVGGRKTRTNHKQKRLRNRNDQINGRRCEHLLLKHNASAVVAANAMLELEGEPHRLRSSELQLRGSLSPKSCEG